MENMFLYKDYREYLKDFFEDLKKKNPRISYRYLSKKLHITSPNFIQNVFEGKRNLSLKQANIFSDVFKLSDTERRYLKLLILANHAKDNEEKAFFEKEIIGIKDDFKNRHYIQNDSQIFSKWYHAIVRHIAARQGVCSAKDIAEILKNLISYDEAEESLNILLKEGHLIREKDNFIVTQPKITAQGNHIVRSIQTFFSLTLETWAKKIHLFPVDKSVFDISYITLTEDELKKLKEYLLSVSSNIVSFESKEHSPEKKCASVGIFLLPIEWIQK